MDEMLAKKLMYELIACHKAIDAAELVSRQIEDEGLRMEFRKVLGRISSNLYSEAMGKIILRYPELDPYLRKPENTSNVTQGENGDIER